VTAAGRVWDHRLGTNHVLRPSSARRELCGYRGHVQKETQQVGTGRAGQFACNANRRIGQYMRDIVRLLSTLDQSATNHVLQP
jgi:hypothetical protein